MVRCGSKNEYKKDACLKEIGLCAQNMVTILGSLHYMIGGDLYMHLSLTNSIFYVNVSLYKVKLLMFYNVQTISLTFVGKK